MVGYRHPQLQLLTIQEPVGESLLNIPSAPGEAEEFLLRGGDEVGQRIDQDKDQSEGFDRQDPPTLLLDNQVKI